MQNTESHPAPQPPVALANALGTVRDQIRALKSREAALAAALGESQDDEFGEIDPTRLPAYIRNDPSFYKSTRVTRALGRPPGGDADFEVLERFG